MIDKTIGFIGGGRITRIFLEGWTRAGAFSTCVTASDPNGDTLAKLKERFPSVNCTSDNLSAAKQDVVFLAVHPPAMAEVAGLIKGTLGAGTLLVSLAPKFTISRLKGLMGGFDRIARVIPNAPSVIGEGFNPVVYSPVLSAEDRSTLSGLLSPLGQFPETAEDKLEAYAVLTGMGPTYLGFQLQALREVAAGFGLSPAEIAAAMERMVTGTTRTLLLSGLAPADVLDLIPVKPLAEMESHVTELYRSRLLAIYEKIKP